MAIPTYLALTSAEFRGCAQLPDKIGWMACHFSLYGTGVSNLPPQLPEGSLLILNDRTPVRGHDPQRILQQLTDAVRQRHISGLLMDFQRAGNPETAAIAAALTALPCPVAVSAAYAAGSDCAVFVPPTPLLVPLADHLQPWKGREVWLEAAMDGLVAVVTPEGFRSESLPVDDTLAYPHYDEALRCHYRIDLSEERAVFTLRRTREDVQALLADAKAHGAVCAVGLYQEFNGR